MDSASDAEYRLRLAGGFLAEAEEDLRSSRWRSCVDDAQLAVENAAKSVIARFGPVRSTRWKALLSGLVKVSTPPCLSDTVLTS
jgi:HEPN domain-containing protein